jgi:branched-chain amino acid transport system substrate-binding protein
VIGARSSCGIRRRSGVCRGLTVPAIALALVVGSGCGPRVERSQSLSALLAQAKNAPVAGAPVAGGASGVTPDSSVGDATTDERATQSAPAVGSSSGGTAAVGGGASIGQQAGRATSSPPPGRPSTNPGGPAGSGRSALSGGSNTTPASGAPAPGTPQNLAPVILGHIGEYSGVVGAALSSGLPMAGVVVRWLNEHGGLNGHPVRLVTGDAQSDPSRYNSLAKQMVERDHVIAFVGNQVSLSAAGAAQYLVDKGVPAVGGDLTHELWFKNSMMFPQGSDLETEAVGVMQSAAKLAKPKVAVFWCAEADLCARFNTFMQTDRAKATGAEVVYSARISLAQPSFTSECLQAQQRGAQTVMLAMDPNAQSRTARDCSQQGFHPLYFSGGVAVVETSKADPNLNGLRGMVSVFPWPAADSPATAEYQNAIKQYAPTMPTGQAAASVWTAGMLLRAASANLPATPTSQDIVAGLYTIRANDLGGLTVPLTFEKGKAYSQPRCYFTAQIDDGKWIAPAGSKAQCL